MNEALQTTLKRLRLSGLASSLDVRLQEATGNGLNHTEFLELVLQDELAVRAERLMNRRVKVAAFREPKTLEDFDFAFTGKSYRLRNKPAEKRSTGKFPKQDQACKTAAK